MGRGSFFGVCVFWRWEKTKGGHEKHAVSQMHLNWRELRQVTYLLAFWDRTLCVCARTRVGLGVDVWNYVYMQECARVTVCA